MNKAPRGKIGRLPKAVQDKVNRRMKNGEPGSALAAWLNGLPEVQEVLAAQFNGQSVSEHNLSQWRKCGYQDWLRWREAQTMIAEAAKPGAGTEPLMDQMTSWAPVYYLMTVRELNRDKAEGAAESRSKLKMLRAFCLDAVALQRAGFRSGKLKLERERLELKSKRGGHATKYPE